MPTRKPRKSPDGKLLQGRPRVELTPDEITSAGKLAQYGIPADKIAHILNIARSTFFDRLLEDKKKVEAGDTTEPNLFRTLLKGRATGDLALANSLFQMATNEREPNVSAAIFLAKVRLGWRETQTIEVVGKGMESASPELTIDEITKRVMERIEGATDDDLE